METKVDPNAREPLKESILIRVALPEGKHFLVPRKVPDSKTGSFTPWLLRTKANP